jgi:hypothetical protein
MVSYLELAVKGRKHKGRGRATSVVQERGIVPVCICECVIMRWMWVTLTERCRRLPMHAGQVNVCNKCLYGCVCVCVPFL